MSEMADKQLLHRRGFSNIRGRCCSPSWSAFSASLPCFFYAIETEKKLLAVTENVKFALPRSLYRYHLEFSPGRANITVADRRFQIALVTVYRVFRIAFAVISIDENQLKIAWANIGPSWPSSLGKSKAGKPIDPLFMEVGDPLHCVCREFA